LAAQRLADDENLLVDHLEEDWATVREETRPDGVQLMIYTRDLNRFFDVNNLTLDPADPPLEGEAERILLDLMTLAGNFSPSRAVSALRDWVDPDNEGLHEESLYRELDPPYVPSQYWIQSMEEWLAIDGFEKQQFERKDTYEVGRPFSADFVDTSTFIPSPRNQPVSINLNTASREVLNGVAGFGKESVVENILALRKMQPIFSLEELTPIISDPLHWDRILPFLGVRSEYFIIEVKAFGNNSTLEVHFLAHRSETGTVQILRCST